MRVLFFLLIAVGVNAQSWDIVREGCVLNGYRNGKLEKTIDLKRVTWYVYSDDNFAIKDDQTSLTADIDYVNGYTDRDDLINDVRTWRSQCLSIGSYVFHGSGTTPVNVSGSGRAVIVAVTPETAGVVRFTIDGTDPTTSTTAFIFPQNSTVSLNIPVFEISDVRIVGTSESSAYALTYSQ